MDQAEQRVAAALETRGPAAALRELVRCLFEPGSTSELTMSILQTRTVHAADAPGGASPGDQRGHRSCQDRRRDP
jgi:hypothetical protein